MYNFVSFPVPVYPVTYNYTHNNAFLYYIAMYEESIKTGRQASVYSYMMHAEDIYSYIAS